jgi:hypothetical protein
MFKEFGGLDGQCHCKVLRRMKLVPVALSGELTEGETQGPEWLGK